MYIAVFSQICFFLEPYFQSDQILFGIAFDLILLWFILFIFIFVLANVGGSNRSRSESPHLKIMKRKDSLKSDDETHKDDLFMNPNIPVDKKEPSKHDRPFDRSNEHRSSRKSSASTLYQETVKGDRQKRYSSSSDSHEKGKLSRQGSNNSVQSKEGDMTEQLHKPLRKDFEGVSKAERELDRNRSRDKEKGDSYEKKSRVDTKSRIDSQRFEELKLTKGQAKQSKTMKEEVEQAAIQEKQKLPKKPSAWSKVVSGENQNDTPEVGKKSLREIQQEEEEEENRKSRSDVEVIVSELDKDVKKTNLDGYERHHDKSSPDENKFRSDSYKRVEKKSVRDEKYDEKYDRVRSERRGRFTDSSNYKRNRDDTNRRDKFRDDGRKDDKQEHRRDRRDDYTKKNERRDDYRRYDYKKDDRKDEHKKDERRHDSKKEERKDHSKTERREDTRKDIGRDISRKDDRDEYLRREERREEQRGDHTRKEDNKENENIFDERRVKREDRKDDWKKNDRRDNYKRDDKRSEYKRSDRDDYRKEDKRSYHKDDKRRDDDMRNYRSGDREFNKRYEKSEGLENKRYDSGKKRHDWNNRDYRQSEEYQKDLKAKQAQKREQSRKAEDEECGNKTMAAVVNESEKSKDDRNTDVEIQTAEQSSASDFVDTKESSVTDTKLEEIREYSEKSTKPKSFGDKGNKDGFRSERSDRNDAREYSSSYRGRDSNRGRGRGRAHSSHSSYNSSNRPQRPVSSGGYNRSHSSKSFDNKRKDDLQYENVSSGEFSDGDYEDEKMKSFPRKEKKFDHSKPWGVDTPPRFKHKYEERSSYYRAHVRGTRGSDRGRSGDRGRGKEHGRGFHSSQSASRVGGVPSEDFNGKNEEDFNGKNEEDFCESVSQLALEEDNAETDKSRSSTFQRGESRSKPRLRGSHKSGRGNYEGGGGAHTSRGGNKGEGGVHTSRGGNKGNSFLLNRQQVGDKRTSKDDDKALSAADKSESKTTEVHMKFKPEQFVKSSSNLEEISEHSPPKKSKPLTEKKRDISREFDLSNIASVVCIDDINTDFDQSNKSKEEDGFVIVTSKKHQKELRDRQREEEKRKILLEQKREAAAANKAQKAARKESQKNAALNAPKPALPFTDAPISSATIEQVPVCTTAVGTPPTQPIASNAAMAAIGAWEPAQSLMRTSQQINPTSNVEQVKTSLASSVNAWQRPLSLSAPVTSMPDPRAVGTGKPSSSHAVNKVF